MARNPTPEKTEETHRRRAAAMEPFMDMGQEEEPEPQNLDPLRGWRKKFLISYSDYGVMREACRAAKVGRAVVMRTLDREPEFRLLFDMAAEDAIDKLELVALKKAHQGNERLIQFILSAKKPRPYGNKTQIEAVINQTAEVVHTEKVEYEPDQLAEILSVLAQSGVIPGPGGTKPAEETPDA